MVQKSISINFQQQKPTYFENIFRESKPDCFRDIFDEVKSLPKGQLYAFYLILLRSWKCYLLIPQQLQHRKGLSVWPGELKYGFAQPPRLLASTHCQFSMPINPSLIQLIQLRWQMNSHQNAILENVFSGGFKMTLKFN